MFDRTAPRLLSLALHLCGDPQDAEDALQETFLCAIRLADRFDAARPLEPWLVGLLANVAHNQRRWQRRRKAEPLEEVGARGAEPSEIAERKELIAQLRQHAASLPEKQRQVVLLQLEHGLAPAEVAEVLGVPPGAVRMRLHRGLERLRRPLPAGLAMLVGTRLCARGLEDVRRAVLSAARGEAAATTGALLTAGGVGGALMLEKGLVVLAVRWSPAWCGGGCGASRSRPRSAVCHRRRRVRRWRWRTRPRPRRVRWRRRRRCPSASMFPSRRRER